jgi:hypothetical protein
MTIGMAEIPARINGGMSDSTFPFKATSVVGFVALRLRSCFTL